MPALKYILKFKFTRVVTFIVYILFNLFIEGDIKVTIEEEFLF